MNAFQFCPGGQPDGEKKDFCHPHHHLNHLRHLCFFLFSVGLDDFVSKKPGNPLPIWRQFFGFGWVEKKILKTSRRRRAEKTLKTSRRHQVMLKGRAPMVVKGGANLCFKSRQPEPGGFDLKKTKRAGPQDSRSNLKIFCCVAPAARSSKK